MKSNKSKIFLVIISIILTIFIITLIVLYNHFSKLNYFTGIITKIDNNTIYVDLQDGPISYSFSKEDPLIYDINGNLINISSLNINDDVYIYENLTEKMEHGTVYSIEENEIKIKSYLSIPCKFNISGIKIKNDKGNKITSSALKVGNTISILVKKEKLEYDVVCSLETLNNVKSIKVLK